MADAFDVFEAECYFCGAPANDDLCAQCARVYTPQDIAAKRLIASILRKGKDQ